MKLTPRKEDIGEGDQFQHRPVEILQIEVRFASVPGFIKSEELAQEVNGRYGRSATNLARAFNLCVGTNWMALANLQDVFAAEFEIDTTQDLHEIKATFPCLQATFVHPGEYVRRRIEEL